MVVIAVSVVSAAAITTAVSAKPASKVSAVKSNERVYDIRLTEVVGKLTVDLGNGHYVGDAKLGRSVRPIGRPFAIHAGALRPEVSPRFIKFGSAPLDLHSHTIHWEGTLNKCDLDWITK